MKILCVSDLHGYPPELPPSDMVILAGDYCQGRGKKEWYDTHFRAWLETLHREYRWVVGIAGNHDFGLQDEKFARSLPWVYLVDEFVEISGLRIYGSPYTPIFHDWAFNESEAELEKRWSTIPEGLDILVTHGPPFGILDATQNYEHVGSWALRRKVQEVKPRYHVFGHIHESKGVWTVGKTTHSNVAFVDEHYKPNCLPYLEFEI